MDQSADEIITRDELDQLQGEVSWLLFHVGAINLAFPRVLFVIYSTTRAGTAEGEGLVGPRPHHFFALPPPLFALKRKIIKIKKKTWNKFFPSIFRYILCIFFNFKRQAFCGAPVLFAVIVPWGRLAPWSNAMPWQLPWPPLRFVRQRVLYFQLRQSFFSVLSAEMKKITSFFKPNEGE